MVIPVPVFAPGRQLQRPQPPYILAGVGFARMIQVCEAVYKTLHVQRVHQANGADPEKSLPAECRAGLIEPAKVSPPEAPVLGAGNVLRGIRMCMMMPVVSYPTGWMPGAVEHGPEDEQLLDHL